MATEYTLLYDIDDGKTYGTDGTSATGSSLPTMAFRDQLQINLQLVRDGENYTGLSSYPSVGVSAAVDNEWTHYSDAELEGSGYTAGTAITTLTLSGVSTTPALVENIALINSSAQSETVAYTGYAETATAGTYNFTVSHTLTYSYADGAEARLGEPLIMKTATGDTTGKNTGMIKFILDGDNSNFQTAIEGQQSLSGAYCQAYIVDGSGNVLLTPTFPVNLIGRLDNDAAIPPAIDPAYAWSKAESDARYLKLVDLDESSYDATGFMIAQSATGGTTKIDQDDFFQSSMVLSAQATAGSDATVDSSLLSEKYRITLAMPTLTINGEMIESQENGTTGSTASGYFPSDGVSMINTSTGATITTQNVAADADGEFTRAVSVTTTSEAGSVAAGGQAYLRWVITGKDAAALKWGTAEAKHLRLVLNEVVAPVAGNYPVTFRNNAKNRYYIDTFNISADEVGNPVTKEVRIPGDTSGTWLTGEGDVGVMITVDFGSGSDFIGTGDAWTAGEEYTVTGAAQTVTTAAAVLRITGIDPYVDEQNIRRPFPHKTYEDYVRECQRYTYKTSAKSLYARFGNGPAYSATNVGVSVPKPRGMGTITAMASSGTFRLASGSSTFAITAGFTVSQQSSEYVYVDCTTAGGLTVNEFYELATFNDDVAYLIFFARP